MGPSVESLLVFPQPFEWLQALFSNCFSLSHFRRRELSTSCSCIAWSILLIIFCLGRTTAQTFQTDFWLQPLILCVKYKVKGLQPPSSKNLTTRLWINTFHLCRLCPLQHVLLSFLTAAESFSFLMSIEIAETYSFLKGPSGPRGWMDKGSRPDPWTAGIVMWKKSPQ